jgi:cytochrome c553
MRRAFKWAGIFAGLVIAIFACVQIAFVLIGRSRFHARYSVDATLPPQLVANASVAMGEKIAITRGCTDCHAAGAAGKVFLDVPPGLYVAPNLTKGRGGVGARYKSADDWNRAIRFGIRPDSTTILTIMPWWFFNRLSDSDVADLAAYLASAPAVDNELPATKLRWIGYFDLGSPSGNPATRRAALLGPRVDTPVGPTAAYGRYIASTACVGCHGEKLLGGPHHDPKGLPAPALTHVGAWQTAEFINAFRTGVVPGGRQLSEWMPWRTKFAKFTDEELTAIHEYLRTLGRGVPRTG